MPLDNYRSINAVDIHHVFPRAWCEQHDIKPADYNSILNKTPLTAKTNRIIGGRAPSLYLTRLASSAETSQAEIQRNVATHVIEPAQLAADDFVAFVASRERSLLSLVGAAMGKAVQVD